MSKKQTRVALITGCSSGIGRATTLHLAGRGWRVFASARRIQDIRDLESTQVDIVQLDVTDAESRAEAVGQVLARAGRLDALVNNAGINVGGPLELVSPDEVEQQFETNVWGPLWLAQAVIPVLRERGGGHIVNVTSVLGRISVPFSGLYGASKHALEALSDSLRWELNPWNIHVVLIEPGFVRTSLGHKSRPFRRRFEDHPLYAAYLKKDSEARRVLQQGDDPVKVAQIIEHALNSRHPRARYRSGLDAQLALTVGPHVPDRLYDFGITRVFGLHRRAK